MDLTAILALLTLLVAVPLNWIVVAKLWNLYRTEPLPILRERVIVAVAVAVIVTVFALVFVNNDLIPPVMAFDQTKLITRSVMLGASVVPPMYWLRLYP